MEWISVEERLPNVGQEVLVGFADHSMRNGERLSIGRLQKELYQGKHNWSCTTTWGAGYKSYYVTHWQPLPEPPKLEQFYIKPEHDPTRLAYTKDHNICHIYLRGYGYVWSTPNEYLALELCTVLNKVWNLDLDKEKE